MTSAALSVTESRQAIGYPFELGGDDDELLRRAAACCRDLAMTGHGSTSAPARYELVRGTSRGTHRLLCDGQLLVDDACSSHVLETLLWHVNTRATHRPLRGHLVLHAAAAALDGRAVLLPGPPGSGKTTLVGGLIDAGFGYLTDEAAAVAVTDRHVEPFHKCLAIKQGSWPVLAPWRDFDAGAMRARWQVPIGRIPGATLATRSAVQFVVFPHYTGGSKTVLEPLARAAAVVQMATATFRFRDAPGRRLDELARIARPARCSRLRIGSLEPAVELIHELMATP